MARLRWLATQRAALQLPPRRAAQGAFKKGTISRAEGGQLQAPVGPRRDRALAAPAQGIQSNIGWGKQPDR